MIKFLDDIRAFLSKKICADSDFAQKIPVNKSYLFNHSLKATEIQVGALDNSEETQYSTLEGEQVAYVPVQITVYAAQMAIGGVVKNPQDVAEIVADKLCRYMKSLHEEVKGVLLVTRTTFTQPLPLGTGAVTYFSALRYDIRINSPYKTKI